MTTGARVQWREVYLGGSPEAERRLFERMAVQIMRTQLKNSRGGKPIVAGFQAKGTYAVDDAELRFRDDLPPELRAGFAQPGAVYRTAVRFSNAEGRILDDREPDLRGVALRVAAGPSEQHDLLMTNAPVSHARDARQFAEFALATAGGGLGRYLGLAGLPMKLGLAETLRIVRNVLEGRRRIGSVATETYWSRIPITWGDELAVQYLLRPLPGEAPPKPDGPDFLTAEMGERLRRGDVRFELCVQRFRSPQETPIEDAAVDWRSPQAPPEAVATLTIRTGSCDNPVVHAMRFNPWNTTDDFRPLGNLNRVRKAAYDASAAHRDRRRWLTDVPARNTIASAAMVKVFGVVNRFRPWHRLPDALALLNLAALRDVLRRDNLIDTETREAPPRVRDVPVPPTEEERAFRTHEGRWNDLSEPDMGAVGAAFGRNVPAVHRPDLVNEPNPILVSRELLRRDTFRPATSLNILAATWIQFQVHDWVVHARHPLGGPEDVRVPLPPGMAGWTNTPGGPLEPEMRIGGNIGGATGGNVASHWWDGSEVYGTDTAKARELRDGAKIRLTPEGYLPVDVAGSELTGFNEAWWLGLSSMHTLFAREHNLLCDELISQNPGWAEERVYQTARLVVSALIAKIHTVEWTPAILATEVLRRGMNVNWNGVPANDLLSRIGLWLTDVNALHGIPKTTPDHHSAPYSLTEDFVTVYRMHPLIPDDYAFSTPDGQPLGERTFLDLLGGRADDELRALGLANVIYSFGTAHPGAITLHNYPLSLLNLEREGELIDLSVVDLVRTRMRGVPRYNDFRAALHMPRITRWEDLTADPSTVEKLRTIYRSIDEVDTMVGLFAETPPEGFGFSDTAFRVFILMASRRLQSDRFLTADYRPEIYTQFGLDWIANTTMTDLIHRHCPELAAVLPKGHNAFAPWK
ncbi:peroxidase family protein [Paractinoplanes lichenicola]|uniref:Peroxidase n=1 Tax=Paractinoplanes lichenicola TaxID=2802976 RepID=A0ABS1W3P4_9ACTN|nr:peroxidase family protein [Actinoplanes lichenicola]MBL7261183.1 peroxidase [Actinoplanes lichenicola]